MWHRSSHVSFPLTGAVRSYAIPSATDLSFSIFRDLIDQGKRTLNEKSQSIFQFEKYQRLEGLTLSVGKANNLRHAAAFQVISESLKIRFQYTAVYDAGHQ